MRRVAALLIVLAGALSGCGTADDGTLPHHPFDPGGPQPGGYGSGSGGLVDGGGGDMTIGPPMCDDSLKRCPHTFTWPSSGNEKSVTLIGDYAPNGWTTGRAMMQMGAQWVVTIPVPWSGKVTYKFHIVTTANADQYLPDPGNPNQVPDGFGGQNSVLSTGTCAVWTCASTQIQCSGGAVGGYDWRDAVMYFVFVDRFSNGDTTNDNPNQSGGLDPSVNWKGGDWSGLLTKLKAGYFQALSVNTLWLTVPVDQSESTGAGVTDGRLYTAYHGYWPRDLTKLEPHFGAQADLQAVVTEAHARGMKIILDYAMHHVHTDSPLWQAHQNDGWFHPLNVQGGQCLCDSVPGSVCSYDGPTGTSCWFAPYLPAFDFTNQAARDFSVGNAISWIKTLGVDGFRLDAIKQIDGSWVPELRQQLTQQVEPTLKSHVYLVGETFSGDPGFIKSYIDPCTKLDGQFDFPLRAQLGQAVLLRQKNMSELASFMDGNTSFYGNAVMSTFIGNHDVPRSIHFAEDTPLWTDIWANGKDRNFSNQPPLPSGMSAFERLSVAFAVLLTNRGVPLIYYGDEIGMPGAGDPDNRRVMDFATGGYSAGQTELYQRVAKLGAARAAHSALRRGDRTTHPADDVGWAYKMTDGTDTVYVLLNRGDGPKTFGNLPSGSFTDAISGQTFTGPNVLVDARSFRLLVP